MTEGSPIPPPPQGEPAASPAALSYQTPGSGGYPGPYAGPAPDKDAKTMGMLCHLLAIFTGFLGPLIIWLMKKDTSPFVDDQGKEALNFQITCFIAFLICIPLYFVFCLGLILGVAVMIVRIVFCILGTVAANKGEAYRYPVTLRLVK